MATDSRSYLSPMMKAQRTQHNPQKRSAIQSNERNVVPSINSTKESVQVLQNKKLAYLHLFKSPFMEHTHPAMYDWRLSRFCKSIFGNIEIVLVRSSPSTENRVGFRLIGCKCPHVDQFSGMSMEGFVYRPASISEFCTYLPVFYVHLRDDKCQNANFTLVKQLESCFHSWTQNELFFREFCSSYFYSLGLREVPGIRGIQYVHFITNTHQQTRQYAPKQQQQKQQYTPKQQQQQPLVHTESDHRHDSEVINKAVSVCPPCHLSFTPKSAFVSKFALPEALASFRAMYADIPQIVYHTIRSLELFQLQKYPCKVGVRCLHCSSTSVSKSSSQDEYPFSYLYIESLSSMPGDIHHFFLYHHVETCGDIPGQVTQEIRKSRPVKFSKEYYRNRFLMRKYCNILQKLMGLVDYNEQDGENASVIISKF